MAEKKVNISPEIVSSNQFECAQCDFKTKDLNKQNQHLLEPQHQVAFGNYPCKLCGKTVTIVPDYIDKPAPGSELPEDNTKLVHEKFTMVSKRPSLGRIQGGLGTCEDCKERLKRELE